MVPKMAFAMPCSIALVAFAISIGPAGAKVMPNKPRSGGADALVFARVWKDGHPCGRGVARLRPLHGKRLDTTRFVDIGYVIRSDSLGGLEAVGTELGQLLTFDISGYLQDARFKNLAERFVRIAPGSYALTSVRCQEGRVTYTMGYDRANMFAAETGVSFPIKGTNVVDVRPGEILDAGVLEIRSDSVGLFERQTASILAAPAPAAEQATLRDAFRSAGRRLRFGTFRRGIKDE